MLWRVLCATLLMAFTAPGAAAEELVLLTEENIPYNHTDRGSGQVTGLVTDVVRLLMERTGTTYRIEMQSWARAFNRAQAERNTCVFATNRTPEREALFSWVPLLTGGWTIFTLKDRPLAVGTVDEARQHPILVVATGALEADLKQQGFDVISTSGENIVRMMERGRANLAAMGAFDGAWRAKAAGVPLAPLFRLRDITVALACSRSTSPDLIDALNKAADKARRDGEIDKILDRYR